MRGWIIPDTGKKGAFDMKNVALKAFRPEGWLREQIRLNAEGFFGHLTDISDYLTDGNGWLQWWKTAEDFAAETGKSAA